jgi:sulfatase maturation enzyme AslB (radical SAM superfamily)
LIAQFSSKSKVLNKYIPVDDVKINNKTDIERFRGSFADLTSLVITGGEPMLDEDCVTLVRMVRQEAKNPKLINFSSNMSIVNTELLDELSKFDCFTSIGVSVDGSPSVHNYVRHRSDFDQLTKNVEFIVKNYPKIKLGFHTSISALTVGYLPELLESVNKMQNDIGFNFNHCMVSSVINRPEIHASVLPDNIKQQYIEKLQSAINPLTVKDSDLVLPTGIHMLNETPTGTIEDFKEFTQEFDRIANTNILDVYPEFSEIFKK